jgi:hypothetical protein
MSGIKIRVKEQPKVSFFVGDPVRGIPAGGTTDQVLAKNSDADYDVDWTTLAEASIPDNSITKPKLVLSVRQTLDKADNSVQQVVGKGLSDENYTLLEKQKLANIEAGAQVNTVTSVAGKTGAVTLAKADVGLGNVDNTSDLNKPVSSATQSTLDLKVDKVTGKGLSDENYTLLEKQKLAGIEAGAQVNDVDSVNGQTGIVVLDADDVSDAATTNKYTTQADKDRLANTSGTNTGDQVIPTSLPPNGNAGGDLTGTYPNPTIGNDTITTPKVVNKNITLAKLEDIATQKLLGRHASGNGVVQQVGIDGGLEIQGANIRRAALTGDVTAPAGSNTTTIANGAVSAAKTDAGVQASLGKADTALQKDAASPNNILLLWSGTQAQYDLLTPVASTLYFIEE